MIVNRIEKELFIKNRFIIHKNIYIPLRLPPPVADGSNG
jgi:hypothetical protein